MRQIKLEFSRSWEDVNVQGLVAWDGWHLMVRVGVL